MDRMAGQALDLVAFPPCSARCWMSSPAPLLQAGDRLRCMDILLEGQAAIMRHGRVIDTVGRGQAIGILSLLDTEARTVTAKACGACEVTAADPRRSRFAVEKMPHVAALAVGNWRIGCG